MIFLVGMVRDTMNTAQRMEGSSKAGAIHVSQTTYNLLPSENWQPTGGVEVGGGCT